MKIIHFNLGDKIELEPLTLAIGYFDGVHLGHQALVNDALDYAKEHQCKCGMMTFDPNPDVVVGKKVKDDYLTSIKDKAEILDHLGADYLIVVHFTREVMKLSTDDFYRSFIACLPVRMIVCGFDFHFGYMGKGNGNTLKELADYPVYIQEEVKDDNKKVSSTRINDALDEGTFEEVNRLLGRVYKIEGEIIKGRQVGRKLGFKTANVAYGHYRIPKIGVYAVKFEVDDKVYNGMGNIGYNPTIGTLAKPSLEVNIFDFDEDIYGKIGKVYFYHMIRGEKKFDSPQGLIDQLHKDQGTIREYFNAEI